ncbi:MAG TPA: SEC-C domain-containing protein [Solirubrobacteraceae bacterium]|nr:SEC-C domain-containing protein [Solirubrobacteraceae bacterium]
MAKRGRNAPCPCGSGRKHKLCCLERAAERRRASITTDRVWERLQEWTIAEHPAHLDAAIDDLCGDDRTMTSETVALLCSYAHLDRELPGGGTPARRFCELPGLSEAERVAASSLAEARLGLWRARSVRAGASIELEEVFGDAVVTVRSEHVSRGTARWDVLLGRVMSGARGHELWGPAGVFEASEEEELVAEVHRLAAEDSITPRAAFRVHAAQLLRFSPPSRHAPPSVFTFEGDDVVEAHARWKLSGDDAGAMLERHPDLVDMADTEDGDGICLEWTAPRRELAARRPELPPRAVLLESTPVFVDPEERCVSADGSRIGLGTFELRPRELTFHAISEQRLDGAIALVTGTLGARARLVERRLEPLEWDGPESRPAGGAPPEGEPSVPTDIREAVIAGFARDRFLRMLDEPDPRFAGLTPREAARSAAQRPRLERWLRTLENSAARGAVAAGTAPDVAMIRRELAMPDDAVADAA